MFKETVFYFGSGSNPKSSLILALTCSFSSCAIDNSLHIRGMLWNII